jgi:hypothetical protein
MLTQPIGTKRETPSRAYSFDFSRAKPRAPQLPAWGSPADSTGVRTTDLEILLDTISIHQTTVVSCQVIETKGQEHFDSIQKCNFLHQRHSSSRKTNAYAYSFLNISHRCMRLLPMAGCASSFTV